MRNDTIDYPALIDQAMRGVVRETLKFVAREGFSGNHHCFISFNTRHPGVRMSARLHQSYPEEMTIVLQHQYWNLEVDEDRFYVTLSFNNIREPLAIPFSALTAFADPSVKFGLQFNAMMQPGAMAAAETASANTLEGGEPLVLETEIEVAAAAPKANIVSLDKFRKK